MIHKYWVARYCFKSGIYWQGIVHDLSKFSPVEFIESVKYYQGFRSPIDYCKEVNGYSKAWLHHKAVNKHHYQYWVDNFDFGGQPLVIPYKYTVEMLCDFLGAGRAYNGKKFTPEKELNWWKNKKSHGILMNEHIIKFMDIMMEDFVNQGSFEFTRDKLRETYERCLKE